MCPCEGAAALLLLVCSCSCADASVLMFSSSDQHSLCEKKLLELSMSTSPDARSSSDSQRDERNSDDAKRNRSRSRSRGISAAQFRELTRAVSAAVAQNVSSSHSDHSTVAANYGDKLDALTGALKDVVQGQQALLEHLKENGGAVQQQFDCLSNNFNQLVKCLETKCEGQENLLGSIKRNTFGTSEYCQKIEGHTLRAANSNKELVKQLKLFVSLKKTEQEAGAETETDKHEPGWKSDDWSSTKDRSWGSDKWE